MRIASIPLFALTFLGRSACNGALRFDEATTDTADSGTFEASVSEAGNAICARDQNCARGLHCETASGKCVACISDANCDSMRPRCDLIARQCVECLATPDCGAKQICELNSHRCLDACKEDKDVCPVAGQTCHDDQGICVECYRDAQCAGAPDRPRCDTPVGRCVTCRSGADCTARAPVCDRRDGSCVECMNSTECPPERPVCAPDSRTCVR